MNNENQQQQEEQNFNYWEFIERYHPNYTRSDEVLLSDDITKVLDNQDDLSVECIHNVKSYVSDLNDTQALIELQTEVDADLFKEALREYLKEYYKVRDAK